MPEQVLPGPHSGVRPTLTSGDPLSRSMGQYGKGHSFLAPSADPTMAVPGKAPGAVRDAKGGLKTHDKFGGLGGARDGGYGAGDPFGAAADNS